MTKWTGRLKQLSTGRLRDLVSSQQSAEEESLDLADGDVNDDGLDSEGWEYINRIREKLSGLVEDLTQGRINRAQFEELYAHYQKERKSVEKLMALRPSSDAWRMAVTEGESIMIRRRLAARVLGYAVYTNKDLAALRVYGEFDSLKEKWVSPLLDRVRSVASKPFVVGTFNTGSKDAACLCAVPGEFTTLIVLFTMEPARVQLQLLEDLHRHFEQANYRALARSLYKVSDLVFPYAAAFE
jgi:hypothetical protein